MLEIFLYRPLDYIRRVTEIQYVWSLSNVIGKSQILVHIEQKLPYICCTVPVVLPQNIVPHNILSHRFCPSDPNPSRNEVVCGGAGRHLGKISGTHRSRARCSGARCYMVRYS